MCAKKNLLKKCAILLRGGRKPEVPEKKLIDFQCLSCHSLFSSEAEVSDI
jgi:hypothetical protein